MLSDTDFLMPDAAQADQDRRLVVRFSLESKLDQTASDKEGRPVYKEVEYVTILVPGDKTLTVHRPVQPSDKARFGIQYSAFKANQGDKLVGTPLHGWPLVTPSQRKELEYFNIRTVEALAEVADGYASNMMGMQQLKQAAQKYLENANKTQPIALLTRQLEERDARLKALEERLNELAAANTKATSKKDDK